MDILIVVLFVDVPVVFVIFWVCVCQVCSSIDFKHLPQSLQRIRKHLIRGDIRRVKLIRRSLYRQNVVAGRIVSELFHCREHNIFDLRFWFKKILGINNFFFAFSIVMIGLSFYIFRIHFINDFAAIFCIFFAISSIYPLIKIHLLVSEKLEFLEELYSDCNRVRQIIQFKESRRGR